MSDEKIEIPFNKAGKRCYEVFAQIAERQLQRAREATKAFMSLTLPNAETLSETAMNGGKYSTLLLLPSGKERSVTYDYRTKAIEIV
jgi:hypothetical protein